MFSGILSFYWFLVLDKLYTAVLCVEKSDLSIAHQYLPDKASKVESPH